MLTVVLVVINQGCEIFRHPDLSSIILPDSDPDPTIDLCRNIGVGRIVFGSKFLIVCLSTVINTP